MFRDVIDQMEDDNYIDKLEKENRELRESIKSKSKENLIAKIQNLRNRERELLNKNNQYHKVMERVLLRLKDGIDPAEMSKTEYDKICNVIDLVEVFLEGELK